MARSKPKTFSEQLRQAIADSGMSLTQLALAAGTDDGALSRFMRGERGLSTRTIDKLCRQLKLELRKARGKGA